MLAVLAVLAVLDVLAVLAVPAVLALLAVLAVLAVTAVLAVPAVLRDEGSRMSSPTRLSNTKTSNKHSIQMTLWGGVFNAKRGNSHVEPDLALTTSDVFPVATLLCASGPVILWVEDVLRLNKEIESWTLDTQA